MNDVLQIFAYNDNMQVRTKNIDNEPWFVAKDVCQILDIKNHKDAIKNLDEDESMGSEIPTPSRGLQTLNFVNESGLYHLIFKSQKPDAKMFRKWVTSEILPTLRKTGTYSVGSVDTQLLIDFKEELLELKTEIHKLKQTKKYKRSWSDSYELQLVEKYYQKPNANGEVLFMTATDIAKELGKYLKTPAIINSNRIGKALARLNYKRTMLRYRHKRFGVYGYYVVSLINKGGAL